MFHRSRLPRTTRPPALRETKPSNVSSAGWWIAWSVERMRPELLILEQRGLREGISEALQDGDYSFNDDAVAEFVLKISRRGAGLDTSYSVLPKPSKVTKAETEAMAEVREMNVSCLTDGGPPFIQPAASFSSDSTEDSEF